MIKPEDLQEQELQEEELEEVEYQGYLQGAPRADLKYIGASPVFEKNFNSKKDIIINRGGTRAGKTYNIMIMLANWLLTGIIRSGQYIESGVASVVRKTFPELRESALKDFIEILTALNVLENEVHYNKSNFKFTFEERTVEFFSLDKEIKVRGRKRNILFANEANGIDYHTFQQLLWRTSDLIILDLNPSDPYHFIKTELEDKRRAEEGDVEVIVSTYKDNPFLPERQKKEIERIKDPQLRDVFVLGNYGRIENLIYTNWIEIKERPPLHKLKKIAVGVDFGFNDQAAIIFCGILKSTHRDFLIVDEILYKQGLDPIEFIQQARANRRKLDYPLNLDYICDSARPELIRLMRNKKLRAKGVKKAKFSIIDGINLLKQYTICVTSRSINIKKELHLYKWKLNSSGKPIDEPVDNFNHALDAVRYYALEFLNKRNIINITKSTKK